MDNIEQHVQHLFQQARQQPAQSSSDEIFGTFLSTIGTGGTGIASIIFNLKHLIIMLSTIAFIASVALWGSVSTANSQENPVSHNAAENHNQSTVSASSSQSLRLEANNVETQQQILASNKEPLNTVVSTDWAEESTADHQVDNDADPNLSSSAPVEGEEMGENSSSLSTLKKDSLSTDNQTISSNTIGEKQKSVCPDSTIHDHAEATDIEDGTTISYVISTNTTFEELEKIAGEAHKAGLMMRYDLKIRNDKIKKMDLYLRYAGESTSCRSHNTHIAASGTFIRNIGWVIDSKGKAIKILK